MEAPAGEGNKPVTNSLTCRKSPPDNADLIRREIDFHGSRCIPLLLLVAFCCQPLFAQSASSHRVGVRVVNGSGQFYLRDTGEKFIPRGNNYIRLAQQTHIPGYGGAYTYHSLFNIGTYDITDVESVLTRMQADGYNTVRVFLNFCCSGGIGNPSGGLSQAYLANVADFLNRAKSHSLFVIVIADGLPEAGHYVDLIAPDSNFADPNVRYLTTGGVQGYSKYWTDIITGLAILNAPFDAVLSWDIQAEIRFNSSVPPLNLTSGRITVANGKMYDLSSSTSRQAMMDDSLIYFIDHVRAAILRVDPTALVDVSFPQPNSPNVSKYLVGDPTKIRTYPAICCSMADFIDLHPYLLDLTLPQLVQNYESAGLTAKPIVMGEYGTIQSAATSVEAAAAMFQKWQTDSCAYGFSGWVLWNWDVNTEPDGNYWSTLSGNGAIDRALRPINRPDPCQNGNYFGEDLAFSSITTASNSQADHPPTMAIDGSPDTYWSSGQFPPQSIELQLKNPSVLGTIRLTVDQFPSGTTHHQVYTKNQAGQYTLLADFNGNTVDRQTLTWAADSPVSGVEAIRIDTLSSPSWVGWREIEVISADSSREPIPFSISGRGGFSVQTAAAAPTTAAGYGVIRPFAASTAPEGIAIFDYRQNNILVSETGVPAAPPLKFGRIYAEINGPADTGLAIANPNDTPASIYFLFTDTAGKDVLSGHITVGAQMQLAKFLDQPPFNAPMPFQGAFSFTSSVPVGVIALRGLTNERGEFLMSTLPVIDTASTAAPDSKVIPHFADGGGWTTQLLLINPTDTTLGGTVQFRNPDGTPAAVTIAGQTSTSFRYAIPWHSSRKLSTSGGGTRITGSVIVSPSGGSAPAALVIFSYKPGDVTISEAGVPVISGTASRMYAESSGVSGQAGSIQSGVAVANPSSSSQVTVTFEITTLSGDAAAPSASITLPNSGQTSQLINDIFPNLPIPFAGILRIAATSGSISVVGLHIHYNERGEPLITTTPPSVENSLGASTGNLIFPQIVDGGGFTTQFILFNGAAAAAPSGNLLLYDANGQALSVNLK